MMNHAISDYFHFDHQFFHTLRPLILKPGKLTNEYMAGRRTQYLHPVKMYIFISLIYFILVFKDNNKPHNAIRVNNEPAQKEQNAVKDSINKAAASDKDLTDDQKKKGQQYTYKATNQRSMGNFIVTHDGAKDTLKTYQQYLAYEQKLPPQKRDGFLAAYINKTWFTYAEKYGDRAAEEFFEEVKHNMPKMMFVLLPLFALILKLAFRNNRKFYVEHLIYSFHLHCFLFLLYSVIIILELVLPPSESITGWLSFAGLIVTLWYTYLSLRAVYHRNAFRTITKMAGITISYFIAGVICLLGLLAVTAMTA